MLFPDWFQNKRKQPTTLQDELMVSDVSVPVCIYFEQRKTVRSSFTKKGINIRLPFHLPKQRRQKQITNCKQWAKERLQKKPNLLNRYRKKVYRSGTTITTFDATYRICIEHKRRKTIGGHVRDDTLILYLPDSKSVEAIQPKHLSAVLADHYRAFLETRLNEWNRQFPVQHQRLRLKYNSSNWGSCSSKRNINLSTRLLLCPLPVIDYVMVHELAHLVHPNHSQLFWQEVARVQPHYKQYEYWLKTEGAHVDF